MRIHAHGLRTPRHDHLPTWRYSTADEERGFNKPCVVEKADTTVRRVMKLCEPVEGRGMGVLRRSSSDVERMQSKHDNQLCVCNRARQ